MTENTSPIDDRAANIQQTVLHIINSKQDEMFEQFDRLHRRGIHDDDVVAALRHFGETDLLDQYAEWGDIDIREDDNTTTNPDGVTDPADSPSYALHPLRMQQAGPGVVVETIEQLAELQDKVVLVDKDGRAAQIVRDEAGHYVSLVGWDGWLVITEWDDAMEYRQIVDAARRKQLAAYLPFTILGAIK